MSSLTLIKSYIGKTGKESVAVINPTKETYNVFKSLGIYSSKLTIDNKIVGGWVFRKNLLPRIELILTRVKNNSFNEKEEILLTKIVELLTKENEELEELHQKLHDYPKEFIHFVIQNNKDYLISVIENKQKLAFAMDKKNKINKEPSQEGLKQVLKP